MSVPAVPVVPLDTLGRAMPPPCPSECIDMTPVEMWAAYWAASRNGTQGIPSAPPSGFPFSSFGKKWAAFVKRWRLHNGGDMPKFWKGYWGKFYSDKAEEGRRNGIPDTSLPEQFWEEYTERFPDGHWEDPTPTVGANGRWVEGKHGYFLVGGQLCYKHPDGNTYEANGVDRFPPI